MKDRSIQTLPRGSILRAIATCNPTSGPERQQSLKNKLLLHLQLVNIPSALSSRLLLLLVTATVTVIAIPVIGFPFCPRGQARWSCLSSSPAPQSPDCYIISSYVSCYHVIMSTVLYQIILYGYHDPHLQGPRAPPIPTMSSHRAPP